MKMNSWIYWCLVCACVISFAILGFLICLVIDEKVEKAKIDAEKALNNADKKNDDGGND